ncbi:hypothetical protein [Nonomuraea wenchangensis]|uniref:Uncharacterized protein n=1 Tax=Nonomuraea wenchangensis TaxID=568860 RepID=A0A1I0LUI7_9ACTN|nr:hypothetical protein [Nonomuraea wenchangensis]SEU47299.1 hypothetical protein SAMN05421811_12883 [Nonomuraea wenchangensis]
MVVAPLTVRRAGDEELVRFLPALSRLLDAATRSPSTGTTTSLLRASHDLDRALESFRKACLPLTHPFNPQRGRRDRARHLLERLEACAYHARNQAVVAGRLPQDDEYATRVTAAADRTQGRVTRLIRLARRRRSHEPLTRRRRLLSGSAHRVVPRCSQMTHTAVHHGRRTMDEQA